MDIQEFKRRVRVQAQKQIQIANENYSNYRHQQKERKQNEIIQVGSLISLAIRCVSELNKS